MEALVAVVAAVNTAANFLGGIFLKPVELIPGWLSITLVSAFLGVLLLLVFKYTSNQKAIARIRDDIKADMLAIKLFKGSIAVAFHAQARVFASAFKLLFYSILPMLFMIVPVSLVLAQMGMWYQNRPVNAASDEEVILRLTLKKSADEWPDIQLKVQPAWKQKTGPVRVPRKKEIYWKIQPLQEGYHQLQFRVGDRTVEKELAVGQGFMRVSPVRSSRSVGDLLLYPLETPIPLDNIVESVFIDYPDRDSRIYGTDWWVLYFFVVSMLFALLFKPFIKVRM